MQHDAARYAPLEMLTVTRSISLPALAAIAAISLSACSSLDMGGDNKVDYRSGGNKTPGLEVPPDLTQLTRDSRYQQTQGSAVSAAAYQASAPAASGPATVRSVTVAAESAGEMRIERQGNLRWLRTSMPPEKLWPQLQAFWKDAGFTLTQDRPASGVMETDWAENRAKLPQDVVRGTIGKLFDGAYSTGELDKFRTRVERNDSGTSAGTDIYIAHRGMVETYFGQAKESTVWQPRAADTQLEAEMLSRLMLRLGATEEAAKTAIVVPGAPGTPARARILADQPGATLQVDDGFDRAWRRVGVALDRSGFTVEDRDRTQGVYFVRYIDPAFAGKEEPGLFAKMFSFGKKDDAGSLTRYRVVVKGEGERSTVSVQDSKGVPDNGDAGKRITTLLLEDLK